MPVDAERLAGIGLFGGLDPETLEALVARVEVRHYAAGDTVYEQGARGRALFVVLEGQVDMRRDDEAVGEERAGAWFGEMSMLDMQPRAVTAVCREETELMVMTCRDLDWLYRHQPKRYAMFVMNIARQLSRKLRQVL